MVRNNRRWNVDVAGGIMQSLKYHKAKVVRIMA